MTVKVQTPCSPILLASPFVLLPFLCFLLLCSAQFYEMFYCFPHVSFLHLLCLCVSFFFSSPYCSFALCLSLTHPAQHLSFYLSLGCPSCFSYLQLILPKRSGRIIQVKDLHKAEASSFSAAPFEKTTTKYVLL